MPAGTYELTVNAAGFKKYVRPGITVQVAETTRVDATLEVGATTDTVTVNAEAPLLKTESGELSHQIDYTEADAIPLFTLNGSGNEGIGNIRDPLSVLTTLPGANFSSDYEIRINGLPSGYASHSRGRPGRHQRLSANEQPGGPAKCGRHSGSVDPDQQFRG